MFVVIYQNKDVCQNDQGDTLFSSLHAAMELINELAAEGFDPDEYQIAQLFPVDLNS